MSFLFYGQSVFDFDLLDMGRSLAPAFCDLATSNLTMGLDASTGTVMLIAFAATFISWWSAHRAAQAASRHAATAAMVLAEVQSLKTVLGSAQVELRNQCGCGYLDKVVRSRFNLEQITQSQEE